MHTLKRSPERPTGFATRLNAKFTQPYGRCKTAQLSYLFYMDFRRISPPMSRKRRRGHREPNGRLSRSERREFAPTRIRRAIDNAMDKCGDPLFGSILGQLALRKHLEAYHVAAGQRYAGLSARYHAATGAPPFTRTGFLEFGMHATDPDPETLLGLELSVTERDVVNRMLRAREVLLRIGRQAALAVHEVCEEDQHPGAWAYPALRAGLGGLAEHWRLLTPTAGNVR